MDIGVATSVALHATAAILHAFALAAALGLGHALAQEAIGRATGDETDRDGLKILGVLTVLLTVGGIALQVIA